MPRAKPKPAAPNTFSEKQCIAVLQKTIREIEDRQTAHNAARDRYVEDIEQQALEAIRERNEIEQQLVDLLKLRTIIADAVLPGAYGNEIIELALRRAALALAAGDLARAHRGLNDTVSSGRLSVDKVTEATNLSETDLFDVQTQSALERLNIVTAGDLVEADEADVIQRCRMIGYSIGRERLAIVFTVRNRLKRVLDRSADAMATRRATA